MKGTHLHQATSNVFIGWDHSLQKQKGVDYLAVN